MSISLFPATDHPDAVAPAPVILGSVGDFLDRPHRLRVVVPKHFVPLFSGLSRVDSIMMS
jgi:hypothetical protein